MTQPPDALGPVVADHIEVGKYICAVAPGVMAQTGCETSGYIRGIAKELDAGFIIAVDSLAARNTGRLNTTIQITDTGINPGSGVGNHRQAINEETMGVPVIAIGVPTVVDAATIVNDVMDNLMAAFENARNDPGTFGYHGRIFRERKETAGKRTDGSEGKGSVCDTEGYR